jgi:hypothetical protein
MDSPCSTAALNAVAREWSGLASSVADTTRQTGNVPSISSAVSRLRLCWLDRRLDRIWRRGRIDRVLSALQARTESTPVVSARIVGTDPVCVAEIVWLDGFAVRIGPCHPGAVADLARLLADGRAVALSRAARSGPVWSLDFALGHLSFPVLAGAVALAPGGGGMSAPLRPLVPQDV